MTKTTAFPKVGLLTTMALIAAAQVSFAQTNEGAPQVDATTGATQRQFEQSAPEPKVKAMPSLEEGENYSKFRIGGYGELVASFLNYGKNRFYGGTDDSDTRRTIAMPRVTLAGDYRFNAQWNLGMEIEFEAGGVGIEQELERTENLEYETEMESGGEVALEQFHITRYIVRPFNIRVGHMIVPMGLTNYNHEPINFFGTSRPEGETTIIPSTWHETGLSFFGDFGAFRAKFDYELMVVAGLNPDGFGRDNWVGGGKQGLFEVDNFSSPAYVGRVNWKGVPGLRVGAAIYFVNDVTKNADKVYKYSSCGKSHLTIWSFDAQYKNPYITVRANFMRGNLENSTKISSVTLSNNSSYHHGTERPVAETAMAYGVEVGANLKNIFYRGSRGPVFYPFARYEYYNPQEFLESGGRGDLRCQVVKWTAGLNWFALPNLVVKADCTTRHIGTNKPFENTDYHNENEFSVGIAYVGWFCKK